ncbi:hypothetical protein NC796_14275 [Aliifodinibius sp. S!AR15-10]|uniref:hypothetical protein n=1 Tax=Aliifodinibius sp. S!AR15-10 TaxID=2950437 RepID=UPI00285E3CC0|nr:hypothetical protein [Aliifodinibius sp. S!AR15-10]MDR8392316.1 hypothetical protein [Aliifodinibius sp. S!AR15-10]
MEKLGALREAIKDYIMENGQEYDRLLVSKDFHDQLKQEATEAAIDFPRMEVKTEVDYEFKLLP